MRRILSGLILLIAVLLDLTILPLFIHSQYLPNFTLLTVISLGLHLGKTRGTLYGLTAGLLVDVSVSAVMGLNTLTLTLIGYGCGYLGRLRDYRLRNGVLGYLLGTLLYEAVHVAYLYLAGGYVTGAVWFDTLWRVLISIVSGGFMYFLLGLTSAPMRKQ